MAISFDTKIILSYIEAKKAGGAGAVLTNSAKEAYKRMLLYGKSGLLSTEQKRVVAKFKITHR